MPYVFYGVVCYNHAAYYHILLCIGLAWCPHAKNYDDAGNVWRNETCIEAAWWAYMRARTLWPTSTSVLIST